MRRLFLPGLIGLALIAGLVWLRFADPTPVQALREIAFDGFQQAAPREPVTDGLRIIDVDEESLAEIGQWPWPRDTIAELTTRLTQLGAAAIVFDMVFPEPDRSSPSQVIAEFGDAVAIDPDTPLRDYDTEFAQAIAASPVVLGFSLGINTNGLPAPKAGFAVVGPNQNITIPIMVGVTNSLPILVDAARGLGNFALDPGGDVSTIRQMPLIIGAGGNLYPALSLEALRVATGSPASPIIFADQVGYGVVESVMVAQATPFQREIPTTSTGALRLYYQETQDNLYVSAKDILGDNPGAFQNLIADNIVFIGTSATGLLDIRGTPLGNMAGVEIHVQAVQQILTEDYLTRADWVSGAEILAFILVGIILIVAVLAFGPLVSFVIGAALAAAMAAGSWFAFTDAGVLVDPSFPLLGSLIVYTAMVFLRYVITDADKRRVRSAFGTYVSPELLHQIEKSADGLKLGGETRELSILFSDIRNFTTLSEGFEPVDLVALLNTLFGALGSQITDQYGTIDKFIGDAIMAFWNAPVDVERHALHACLAALGMRQRLAELNRADGFGLRSGGHASGEIAIGIGIATGEVLVGNLGLETRFDYSCVGDTVNVASRVEGACKTVGYDLVVAGATREAAPELAYLEAGSLALKGKTNREPIHILLGGADLAGSTEFLALAEAHQQAADALRSGGDVNAAIDRCLTLIRFDDPLLAGFYGKLRDRAADFAGLEMPDKVPA